MSVGLKTPFTKAECESYGIDCHEDCTHDLATRRVLQGGSGGSGGTQVTANKASAARLKILLDCLTGGGTVKNCASKI